MIIPYELSAYPLYQGNRTKINYPQLKRKKGISNYTIPLLSSYQFLHYRIQTFCKTIKA